jgi:hypothetical protein
MSVGTYAVVLTAIFSLLLVLMFALTWRRAEKQAVRYKLYAVRDELCFLVTVGEIRENGVVFQVTTKQINGVLNNFDAFTLRSFVRAYMAADKNSLANDQRRRNYFRAVEQSSPAVQKAVERFYRTMLDVLVANSLLLHVYLRVRRHGDRLWSLLRPLRRALRGQTAVLTAYRLSETRLSQVPDR